MKEIIELNGTQPGPTSMILVGVHGNERCGVEAIEQLLPTLTIQKGKVIIVYGNLRAIEQDVRFTETNLNRMFKPDDQLTDDEKNSYEYSRAQFLKQYLDQVDVLLDVHASFTPVSKRFVICEKNSKDITQYIPVSTVVYGFDAIQPGGTDYYMNTIGKIGICIECGYLGDPNSTEVAKESIVAFLQSMGHIEGRIEIQQQQTIQITTMYMTKTDNFVLTKKFDDFEEVKRGKVIGIDGVEEIKAEYDGIILFTRNRERLGEEGFLFGKFL